MRAVEEAQAEILESIRRLGVESVALLDALDRALAEDIRSGRTLPPWDNSEMDGYAIRSGDTEGTDVVLTVQGEVAAGHRTAEALLPGHAFRIFTGAPMPPGADAVIKQEDVVRDGDRVRLPGFVAAGNSVRARGSDLEQGDQVIRAATVLNPGEIGLCAALGRTQVLAVRRPVVAILSTGDELCEPDQVPGPGQIVNSNSLAVAAQVRRAGGIAVRLGIARDDPEEIARRLRGANFADALITIGGVSVGDHDHVRDVLASLGCELRFWRVNVKPGKPVAFGSWNGRPVFGLPGNPVSSMVTFELFVRPALAKMAGRPVAEPRASGRLARRLEKTDGRRHYLRAVVTEEGGDLAVAPLSKQESHQLTSMVGVNALAIFPEQARALAEGDRVELLLLGGVGAR